jgi:hypothetical protein
MFLAEYISIRYCFDYLGYQLTNLCAVYVPGSRASYPWLEVFVPYCWRWPESISAKRVFMRETLQLLAMQSFGHRAIATR